MFSRIFSSPSQLIDKILNTEANWPDIVLSRLSARLDERFAQRAQRFAQESRKSCDIGEMSASEASSYGGFQAKKAPSYGGFQAKKAPVTEGSVVTAFLRTLELEEKALTAEGRIVNEIEHYLQFRRIYYYFPTIVFLDFLIVLVSTAVVMVPAVFSFWRSKKYLMLAYYTLFVGCLATLSILVLLLSSIITELYEYQKEKKVLSIITDFHWAAVGLVVVGAALKVEVSNRDSEDEGDGEYGRLLRSINALSKVILQLQDFPGTKRELHATLNTSIHLIVKGAILCYYPQIRKAAGLHEEFLRRNIGLLTILDRWIYFPGRLAIFWLQIREKAGSRRLQQELEIMREIMRDIDDMAHYFRGTVERETDSSRSRVCQMELQSSSSTISRVREDIRRLQPKLYNPKRVGLGIHHEMNPYSTEIGEKKVRALCTTVKRLKGMTIDNLVGEIQNSDIRSWYKDNTGSTEETLARNIAIDACFVLEFFRSSYWFLDNDVEREIMIDIFKLENQIPLSILSKILKLEFRIPANATTKLASMLCMQPQFAILPFYLKPIELEILKAEVEANIKEHPCHLLHLLSKIIEAFLRPSNIPMNDLDTDIVNDCIDFMSSVVRRENIVQKFLIRFKPSKDGKVRFKKGWFGSSVLYLPQIFLSEDTESLLWNFIAFAVESESKIISHFIYFLNSIIRSRNENIALLRQAQVIVSQKNDEELDTMFRNHANVICERCGPFQTVQRQISEQYNNSFNKRMLQFTSLLLQIVVIGTILLSPVVVSRLFIR